MMSRAPRGPHCSRESVALVALSRRAEYEYGWLIRLDHGAYVLGPHLHASKSDGAGSQRGANGDGS